MGAHAGADRDAGGERGGRDYQDPDAGRSVGADRANLDTHVTHPATTYTAPNAYRHTSADSDPYPCTHVEANVYSYADRDFHTSTDRDSYTHAHLPADRYSHADAHLPVRRAFYAHPFTNRDFCAHLHVHAKANVHPHGDHDSHIHTDEYTRTNRHSAIRDWRVRTNEYTATRNRRECRHHTYLLRWSR